LRSTYFVGQIEEEFGRFARAFAASERVADEVKGMWGLSELSIGSRPMPAVQPQADVWPADPACREEERGPARRLVKQAVRPLCLGSIPAQA